MYSTELNATQLYPDEEASGFLDLVSGTGQSLVVGVIGPRGSGKTLLIVLLSLIDMSHGIECMSNTMIEGPMRCMDGKVHTVKSKVLEYVNLITMGESMKGGLMTIDEINMWFDSLRFQNNGSLMFNAMVQQIRKRDMGLYYTTQNFKWVDNRIRTQTDLLVSCRDAYCFGGRENGLKRGELIHVWVRDISGYLTGRPYDPDDEDNKGWRWVLYGKPVWQYYNTGLTISPFDSMMNMQFKKPKMQVFLDGSEPPDNSPSTSNNATGTPDIPEAFDYLKNANKDKRRNIGFSEDVNG